MRILGSFGVHTMDLIVLVCTPSPISVLVGAAEDVPFEDDVLLLPLLRSKIRRRFSAPPVASI